MRSILSLGVLRALRIAAVYFKYLQVDRIDSSEIPIIIAVK
jgi:hypothetical protein